MKSPGEAKFRRLLAFAARNHQNLVEGPVSGKRLEIAGRTPLHGACVIDAMPVQPALWIRVTLTKAA